MTRRQYIIIILLSLASITFLILLSTKTERGKSQINIPTSVERIFPGGEAVFVRTNTLVFEWKEFKETSYYQKEGYAPLLDAPLIRDLLLRLEENGVKRRDVNLDIVADILGFESALGVYPKGEVKCISSSPGSPLQSS